MKKILVVDQDKNVTFSLQQLLEAESFNVITSPTVSEATVILKAEVFDLVIITCDTAEVDGGDIVDWLQLYAAETKIILLTVNEHLSISNKNILGIIQKTADYVSLVNIIKTHLGKRGFSGVLNDVHLEDYIQIFCMNGTTKAILVSQGKEKGIVLIKEGRVIYAVLGEIKGEEAFYRIMAWKKGTFKEVKVKKFPPPNIEKDTSLLILEASNYADNNRLEENQADEHEQYFTSPISEEVLRNLQLNSRSSIEDEPGIAEKANTIEQRLEQKILVAKKRKFKRVMLGFVALVPVLFFLVAAKTFLFAGAFAGNLHVSVAVAGNKKPHVEIENPGIDDSLTEKGNPNTTIHNHNNREVK